MRTKTIELTVFKYSELSEKAKSRAWNDYAESFGYDRAQDAIASLEAGAKTFGCKLCDYGIDWYASTYSRAKFDCEYGIEPEDIEAKINSLGEYNQETFKGAGDCKLTGYSSDEDFLDGVRRGFFVHKETDLKALMERGFRSWLKACQEDVKFQAENFEATCEANDWEFLENGKLA